MFAKSSNNTINIITIIASFGVIVGSLALFVILSGFSGLRTFSDSLLDVSDPDIKITTSRGKSFLITDTLNKIIHQNKEIVSSSKVIEERVFLRFKDKELITNIKGVDVNYNKITKIDSVLLVGTWLDQEFLNTAVIGNGISYKLSLGVRNFGESLEIFVPKPGKGLLLNPANAFRRVQVQIVGVYAGTQDFESKFVFVNLHLAKQLLRYKEHQITGVEIKLKDDKKADIVRDNLQKALGNSYKVQTKAQLNTMMYKVLNTENFISYLIFTLIVIIALFNVIGAIIMMIIDKQKNLKTLVNLGTTVQEIKKIFVFQGFLLTLFGMFIGITIGVILVFLQQQFGFFMITRDLPYPVEFRFSNLFVVIFTITVLGFIASKVASSRISKDFVS